MVRAAGWGHCISVLHEKNAEFGLLSVQYMDAEYIATPVNFTQIFSTNIATKNYVGNWDDVTGMWWSVNCYNDFMLSDTGYNTLPIALKS